MIRAAIPNFAPLFAEIILVLGIFAQILVGIFSKQKPQRRVFFTTFIFLGLIIYSLLESPHEFRVTLNEGFINDFLTLGSKLIILFFVSVALLSLYQKQAIDEALHFEIPILIMLIALGMMFMISANDLLTLFLSLELQSLGLYVLVAVKKNNSPPEESALKYFILGALSSGLMLFGISLLYGFTAGISFEVLHRFFKMTPLEGFNNLAPFVGMALVIVGLCFKLAAAPFHYWAPDVYQGSSTGLLTFISSAPKFAAFIALVQLISVPFWGGHEIWSKLILAISILSMFMGAYGAITQTNIRRFLAYSSIGQLGFGLISLAMANELGMRAGIVYMSFYSLMILGVFLTLLDVNRMGFKTENLTDLSGMVSVFPYHSIVLAIIIFSMAGIPPLPGFLTKVYVLDSAINNNAYWLSFWGVLYSVLAAAYYLIFLKSLFLSPISESATPTVVKRQEYILPILITLVIGGHIFVMVNPNPLLTWANRAVTSMFFERS